jgi:hypothetical protein
VPGAGEQGRSDSATASQTSALRSATWILAAAAIASGALFAVAFTVQLVRNRPHGRHRAG